MDLLSRKIFRLRRPLVSQLARTTVAPCFSSWARTEGQDESEKVLRAILLFQLHQQLGDLGDLSVNSGRTLRTEWKELEAPRSIRRPTRPLPKKSDSGGSPGEGAAAGAAGGEGDGDDEDAGEVQDVNEYLQQLVEDEETVQRDRAQLLQAMKEARTKNDRATVKEIKSLLAQFDASLAEAKRAFEKKEDEEGDTEESGADFERVDWQVEDWEEDEEGRGRHAMKDVEGFAEVLERSKVRWRAIPKAPEELLERYAKSLGGFPRQQLVQAFEKLRMQISKDERGAVDPKGKKSSVKPIVYGPRETLGYLSHRAILTYHVAERVLGEVRENLPLFAPSSLLDFGAGCGSATWGARSVFGETVEQYQIVEPSQSMLDVANVLLDDFPGLSTRRTITELTRDQELGLTRDLVLCSYVLSELPTSRARLLAVEHLWHLTAPGGVLVLIDRGSPLGSEKILEARRHLLLLNGWSEEEGEFLYEDLPVHPRPMEIVGPCPHSFECPMGRGQWCHFSQRVPRYGGPTPQGEFDEKFSYLAIYKSGSDHSSVYGESKEFEVSSEVKEVFGDFSAPFQTWSRIVRNPTHAGKHVLLDLCTQDGEIQRKILTKRETKAITPRGYKAVRKSAWGGLWPPYGPLSEA